MMIFGLEEVEMMVLTTHMAVEAEALTATHLLLLLKMMKMKLLLHLF
jgi:hypothetical protein